MLSDRTLAWYFPKRFLKKKEKKKGILKTLQTKVKNVLSHNKNTLQPNEYHTYKNGRDETFMSPTHYMHQTHVK